MKAAQRRPAESKTYTEGRDEMNLAEFPISVLQRQQPVDDHGTKIDRAAYESTRYDTTKRQRVLQRVVLETNSRYGLPTPADENVVLALLFVAKHSHNFADAMVQFTPRQLFRIMGWSPNSRSYDRLREVLRRLKALVIRYENSWWGASDRGYEAEFATGIISEYELGRQVAGRKKDGEKPVNWVRWSPHFQQSLTKGNLKKLDLVQLFSLRLPTSQRMYRFLDKRFYPRHQPPAVAMDLVDFACGHVGLSRVDNVAELKRRLAPAIVELEKIGFIAREDPKNRYQKVRPGIWRVHFIAGETFRTRALPAPALPQSLPIAAAAPMPTPAADANHLHRLSTEQERALATAYYKARGVLCDASIGPSDIHQAREMIGQLGHAHSMSVVAVLAQIVNRKWPDCRSFSGAASKYLADAIAAQQHNDSRVVQHQKNLHEKIRNRTEAQQHAHERHQLESRWNSLNEEHRAAIERDVLVEFPELKTRPGILRGFCLNRLK